MKTAISVPDRIAQGVDAQARKLGISRSQFYAEAAEIRLRQLEELELSAQLEAHYSKHSSRLTPEEWEATRRALLAVEWEE